MKKITINKIDENIYYEKLDNGMDVYFYVNKNLHNNAVTFTTRYGSVYNEILDKNGKYKKVPNGIAHFLEHKVFVQKEGMQPEEFYGMSGCLSNAYTTFKNTTYLFTQKNFNGKCLDLLIVEVNETKSVKVIGLQISIYKNKIYSTFLLKEYLKIMIEYITFNTNSFPTTLNRPIGIDAIAQASNTSIFVGLYVLGDNRCTTILA